MSEDKPFWFLLFQQVCKICLICQIKQNILKVAKKEVGTTFVSLVKKSAQ